MGTAVVWSFAERLSAANTVAAVESPFFGEVSKLGFAHAACASHVDPLKPPAGAVMMVRYPPAWLEHFSARDYALRDPVYEEASRQALPFQWRSPDFRRRLRPDQIRILQEAADYGLGDGFTVPLHCPGALPASCSLVIGPDGVDPLDVRNAHWFAVHAHEAARRLLNPHALNRKPRLSPRERQCLELVGVGKDDHTIAALVGIRPSTAHNTVQRAMKKYGVATRTQAVVRALSECEIRLDRLV